MKEGHEFTDEELDKLMYLWDEKASKNVREYLYMKQEWRQKNLGDGGDSTEDGNSKIGSNGIDEESGVFLELDTSDIIHVVEFYSPWCPHCIHLRSEFIEIAAEVSRRLIGGSIQFHAVSCELFPMICRPYGVTSFPVIYGYQLGANIREQGVELNPVDGPPISAESIAEDLNLNLAASRGESTNQQIFNNSEDQRIFQKDQAEQAQQLKLDWNLYPSSLDERYHNAAASLVFVLKTGVYVGRPDFIGEYQIMALKEFLELIHWTTPKSWHVRTGMVQELLDELPQIVSGASKLKAVVDRHIRTDDEQGLWGRLNHHPPIAVNASLAPRMPKWTKACTHGERSLGFTCGLWHLFHIITIGSSLPEHQLAGFRNGYLVAPADVAEILKRFIEHFFGCEVCRRNFVTNFDNCALDHCERLSTIMPVLETDEEVSRQSSVELAKWLNEMHNAVNVRLMYEGAQRQGRIVTLQEQLSAMFPPVQLCPHCWRDENLTDYDPHYMMQFLYEWYWPSEAVPHQQSGRTMQQNRFRETDSKTWTNSGISPFSLLAISISGLAVLAWVMLHLGRRKGHLANKTL